MRSTDSMRGNWKPKREILRQLKEAKWIAHTYSPFAAPSMVVRKNVDESGKPQYRMTINYQELNALTISPEYPLPTIQDILDLLHRARVFTVMDMEQGCHHIRMDPAQWEVVKLAKSSCALQLNEESQDSSYQGGGTGLEEAPVWRTPRSLYEMGKMAGNFPQTPVTSESEPLQFNLDEESNEVPTTSASAVGEPTRTGGSVARNTALMDEHMMPGSDDKCIRYSN